MLGARSTTVVPRGKSVASACCYIIFTSLLARVPHAVVLAPLTMTLNSTSNTSSILEGGKLKPGIYKIQNIQTGTYLDVEVHTREVCCRPPKDLEEGRGFWEIKSLGAGYTVQFVEPGKPEQFCTPPEKLGDSPLAVAAYPVAWRVEVVDDAKHRGFEYVRFCWGSTDWAWSLTDGCGAPTLRCGRGWMASACLDGFGSLSR
ncbi:hypothetical protein BDM02DRAFT_1745526 [Thelephora ganbajun]|uniref:Uncharacterized protein n=1 Tax=Thelephora ganbajun TaxID=370292 RepID=A0ACB6ZK13_THEGA|nr:hypothetical protein BDM02DRAFT_1745526 [Thelephora ganbajun]